MELQQVAWESSSLLSCKNALSGEQERYTGGTVYSMLGTVYLHLWSIKGKKLVQVLLVENATYSERTL